MSQMHNGKQNVPGQGDEDDLEQLLLHGVTLQDTRLEKVPAVTSPGENEAEGSSDASNSDIQGALGLYAEAAQDMATSTVELGLGRHFACADFCNQAVEKAAQAISLLRYGRRSAYDHDLRALAVRIGAPQEIQDEMAKLTPFHPEAFYANTPPEEADEIISAELAGSYIQSARKVMRWARDIVLSA